MDCKTADRRNNAAGAGHFPTISPRPADLRARPATAAKKLLDIPARRGYIPGRSRDAGTLFRVLPIGSETGSRCEPGAAPATVNEARLAIATVSQGMGRRKPAALACSLMSTNMPAAHESGDRPEFDADP